MKTKNISKIILIILLSQFFISIQFNNVNAESVTIDDAFYSKQIAVNTNNNLVMLYLMDFNVEEAFKSSEILTASFSFINISVDIISLPEESMLLVRHENSPAVNDWYSTIKCWNYLDSILITEEKKLLFSESGTYYSDNGTLRYTDRTKFLRVGLYYLNESAYVGSESFTFIINLQYYGSYTIDTFLEESEFMNSVITLVPTIIILFFLPSIAYMQFGKSGFIIMLILSSIIAFMSDLVNLQTFIILLISDVIISLIAYKKLNYEGKYQNVQ